MSSGIFLIVLFAAFMHAVWNAVVKGATDRTISFGLVTLGHTLPAILIAPFVPLPTPSLWPYILASAVIHWGYYYFLNTSYKLGDLSLVYPVARGIAPLLVAIPALIFLDESLPKTAWIGLFLISAGILLIGLKRKQFFESLPAFGVASLTGGTIALYTLVDGVGVRLANHTMTYITWLFIAEGAAVLYILLPRIQRLKRQSRHQLILAFAGGLLSALAYGLALYAKTKAPLGMVSALRETSVVIASMIGVFWFGEGPARIRLLAAAIVVAGIVMLALA